MSVILRHSLENISYKKSEKVLKSIDVIKKIEMIRIYPRDSLRWGRRWGGKTVVCIARAVNKQLEKGHL